MKLIITAIAMLIGTLSMAQKPLNKQPDPNKKLIIVEASCGQCQFKMQGKGCKLAVKIEGKFYFVENADIDDFGDAHSKEGFCNAIRKAKVQGDIVDNKFVASYIEMIEK